MGRDNGSLTPITSNGSGEIGSDEKKLMVTPENATSSSDARADANLIKNPTNSDVLCGRGGSINSHPGNERFRKLVEKRKRVYLTARFKREKRLIACSIVSEIRALDPPGRFLTRDTKSNLWRDIGDEKARDKTSQALRENAPTIRAEIETEINEQRAEIMRAEEEEAMQRASQAPQQPPPFYGYFPPWGYGHTPPPGAPPPGGPPPPHGHHTPTHHHGHPPPPQYGQWGGAPHPGPPAYPYGPEHYESPPHHSTATPPKSTIEQTTDMVMSGAESIKNWTKESLSFGGTVHSVSSVDGHESRASSKPLSYIHDDGKRRRTVKFQDEARRTGDPRQPTYSPIQSTGSNSLLDGQADDSDDMEPHSLQSTNQMQDDSLMNHFANHVLVQFGSWDTSTLCGTVDNTADHETSFLHPEPEPTTTTSGAAASADGEDMDTVEWEGQEVQLMDNRQIEHDSERMPPPAQRKRQPPPQESTDAASSIAFSSLGSCHSWLPAVEQFGAASAAASSFFSTSRTNASSVGSVDMDYSMGGGTTEGASVGGGSLTRVFEHEALPDDMPAVASPMNGLNQMPSWEQSLRARSPLSIGSDDESLVSKSSDKVSVSSTLSPVRTSSPTNMETDDGAWQERE